MINQFFKPFFLLTLLLAANLACRKSETKISQISDFRGVIQSFTGGVIAPSDKILIRLQSELIAGTKGEKAIQDIVTFDPFVKVKTNWKDDRTLEIIPETAFKPGQKYVVDFHVGKIEKELKGANQHFIWEINVDNYYTYLKLKEAGPNNNGMYISGEVVCNDVQTNHAVEDALQIKQSIGESKKPTISWIHDKAGKIHQFRVEGLQRNSEENNKVEVLLNKNLNGVGEERQDIIIPNSGSTGVLLTKIKAEENPFVEVYFSDVLDVNQNLDGLIKIGDEGINPGYAIIGNLLKIFPETLMDKEQMLQLPQNLKFANGNKLGNNSEILLNFSATAPAVKILGRGTILPDGNQLYLPIESINLDAIDLEIFKIYSNNVLEYFQMGYEDDYNLQYVGNIIFQEKIPLSSLKENPEIGKWNRFGIDLSKYIKTDPNSIYQVRIGFKKGYARIPCMVHEKNENLVEVSNNEENLEERVSILANYFGEDGYDDNFYKDEKNPCKKAYYNSTKVQKRNLFHTNIGLIAKVSESGEYFAITTDIVKGEPMANTKITFLDKQKQIIEKAVANSDGFAKGHLSRDAHFVEATDGKYRTIIKVSDMTNLLNISSFLTDGAALQKGLKGMIYAERDIWRPGDSIYLNFILYDKLNKVPSDQLVTFELRDINNQLVAKKVSKYNQDGIYPLPTATNEGAPTGTYTASVFACGTVFSKSLKIENIKPNRLKIEPDFGKDILRLSQENVLSGRIKARWLNGATANSLKVKTEISFHKTSFDSKKYGEYQFNSSESFPASTQPPLETRLNENGEVQITKSLNLPAQLPAKLYANIKTRVYEEGGDFSVDQYSLTHYPYQQMVGIKVQGANQFHQIRTKKQETIQLKSIFSNDQSSGNQSLHIQIQRVDWRWWWDENGNSESGFNTEKGGNVLLSQELKCDAQGNASINFTFKQWGRYMITAENKSSGHSASLYVYADFPYDDGQETAFDAATMLAFTTDKNTYTVGENAQLSIPCLTDGRLLVTVESGAKVIKSFWKEVKAGQNIISIPITDEMSPNIYFNVVHIRKLFLETNAPLRMYGVVSVNVKDPANTLEPEISMPDDIRPEKDYSIKISEKSGKLMSYSLVLVDEGLLDLTRFQTPDPKSVFLSKEALGIKTFDIYDQVIGNFKGLDGRIVSIGGDAAIAKSRGGVRSSRFKPIVLNLGTFQLPKNKSNTHTFRLPNYIGTVRAMVVANQRGKAFGSADKNVLVKTPLMALMTLPRSLAPGDRVDIPIQVFSMDQKIKNVAIALQSENGLVQFPAGKEAQTQFSNIGDKTVYVSMVAGAGEGNAKISLKATSGGESANHTIQLPIVNNSEPIYKSDYYQLYKDKPIIIPLKGIDSAKTLGVSLEVSGLPVISFTHLVDQLVHYPFGCLEQTLSAAFPQLFLPKVVSLSEDKKQEIRQNINAAILKIKNHGTSEGGYSYWPGFSEYNAYCTSYTGEFLIEAEKAGYSIDQSTLSNWRKFQERLAKSWSQGASQTKMAPKYAQYDQAYRLYTLALAGAPDYASMNALRQIPDLHYSASWYLAGAFALAGKKDIAKKYLVKSNIKPYFDHDFGFGSKLRDLGIYLKTSSLIQNGEQNLPYISEIVTEINGSAYHNTHGLATALAAVSKYYSTMSGNRTIEFELTYGDNRKQTISTDQPMIVIPMNASITKGGVVSITSKSLRPIFAKATISAKPYVRAREPFGSNLTIQSICRKADGSICDITNLQQGNDYNLTVEVVNPGILGYQYRQMALSVPVSAGWEIINDRLDNQGANVNPVSYTDIKDNAIRYFFDLDPGQSKKITMRFQAAYLGYFYLPPISCQAMYDPAISAHTFSTFTKVSIKK